jgi:tRNA U34 5-methylaminomethyl-2-thiouridine-forming methyltransferase MnmC
MNRLVTTADGSHTIYVPELNEHYHSVHGAIQESDYIFIRNGFDYCGKDPVSIFEAGFGTGLNALLTAITAIACKRTVNYVSIEKYPLDIELVNSLNYYNMTGSNSKELFDAIHSAAWDIDVSICDGFNLRKIKGDLTTYSPSGSYDIIYFDAFGPDKQPEMWTDAIFKTVAEMTRQGGVFVTYSAKGQVKRRLKEWGFEVFLLPGPPGKRQIIRAVKK